MKNNFKLINNNKFKEYGKIASVSGILLVSSCFNVYATPEYYSFTEDEIIDTMNITFGDKNDVIETIEDVLPAVVSVNTTVKNVNSGNEGIGKNAGSGIIYKEKDNIVYIITNNHVVSGATSATISLDGSEEVKAHYVGSEPSSDLAILYVDKTEVSGLKNPNYKVAKFGNSSKIKVGESVTAIGNALGEGKVATQGIISAIDKNINVDGIKLNVLQTDAAINPGNSGGALINNDSEVIGINTAKLASTGIEGMGYSIPSNTAIEVAERIINKEIQQTAYLGINGLDINEEMQVMYNLPAIGVYIDGVFTNGTAYDIGLKEGDIIVGINGEKIDKIEKLDEFISNAEIDDPIKVYIFRDGKTPLILEGSMAGLQDNTNF